MNEIDLAPLVPYVLEILGTIAVGLGMVAIHRLSAWLKIKRDSEVRLYLETALLNGVELAKRRIAEQGKDLTIATKHEAIAHAANYVIEQVPDALKIVKADEEAVKRAVEARLPALPTVRLTYRGEPVP